MLYAVLAVAHGKGKQVLDAVPGMELVRHPDHGARMLAVTKAGTTRYLYPLSYSPPLAEGETYEGIRLPVDSNASNGRWDIYVLVADSGRHPAGRYRWVARAMRWLRKRSAESPGWILGPWSLKHLSERYPAVWAQLEGKLPHLMGCPPSADADYRPIAQDIDGDTDPAASDIYPEAPPPWG